MCGGDVSEPNIVQPIRPELPPCNQSTCGGYFVERHGDAWGVFIGARGGKKLLSWHPTEVSADKAAAKYMSGRYGQDT